MNGQRPRERSIFVSARKSHHQKQLSLDKSKNLQLSASPNPKKNISVSRKTSAKQQGNCVNHLEKQAKFQVSVANQPLFYCQKCAINLASQGFSVQQIAVPVNISTRGKQVIKLMKTITQTCARLQQTKRNQQQSVNQHFKILIKKLQNERDEMLQRTVSRQLSVDLMALAAMKKDIQATYQLIVNQITQDQFRPIFSNYQQRCSDIGLKLKSYVSNRPQRIDIRKFQFPQDKQNLAANLPRSRLSFYEPIKNPIEEKLEKKIK